MKRKMKKMHQGGYRKNSENYDQAKISEKLRERKKQRKDPLSISLKFLKFRARSEWEIENKLKYCGFSQEDISNTISKLKEKDFINDEKFAYLYAYDSLVVRHKGPFRIRYELRQLHVNENIIEDALKKVLDEVDVEEIIQKITNGLDEKKKKEKLYRQGFGGEW